MCTCRAQKQIAELEGEIEALEEELEKAAASSREAVETRAAVEELNAEVESLREKVTDEYCLAAHVSCLFLTSTQSSSSQCYHILGLAKFAIKQPCAHIAS